MQRLLCPSMMCADAGNLAAETRALDAAGVRYWGGQNAPYSWMQCPAGMKSWDFFDLMLDRIQVIGTPGEGFGACGEGFFRLSSFGNPGETKIAAERIRHLVDSK